MFGHLLVVFLLGAIMPARALQDTSAADLERLLSEAGNAPDRTLARDLSTIHLNEYIPIERLQRFESECPGEQCRRALIAVADQAAFTEAAPEQDKPDLATQKAIVAKLVDSAIRFSRLVPNFIATRTMTRFQDTPKNIEIEHTVAARDLPLEFLRQSRATITYRAGREDLKHEHVLADRDTSERSQGLEASGLFGVLVRTVILDSSRSSLAWERWDRSQGEPLAVFRFTVPMDKSRYEVKFCCIPKTGVVQAESIDRFSAYHGEIAIRPEDGSVAYIRLMADLEKGDPHSLLSEATEGFPLMRANVFVEYRRVQIGGETYVCPIHAVALSTTRTFVNDKQRYVPGPPRTHLNDVTFTEYHVFRSESRIVPEPTAK